MSRCGVLVPEPFARPFEERHGPLPFEQLFGIFSDHHSSAVTTLEDVSVERHSDLVATALQRASANSVLVEKMSQSGDQKRAKSTIFGPKTLKIVALE